MSKIKLFVENFLVYGFGGVISKIVPLIMIPIITRLMPSTEYFGLTDLSVTLVSFCSALAIMGMYDAMYRLFFEKDEMQYKVNLCSTTLFFTLFLSLIVALLMFFFQNIISKFVFGNVKYNYLVLISALSVLVGASELIISAPTRMQNKRKIFLITNTLSPLVAYTVAIVLLLNRHYIIALPIGTLLSSFLLEIIFMILNGKWFSIKKINFKLLKQLLVIGVPLLPNFLIYWIFNSSDRIMISNLLDVGQSGIYAVGSKLGHLSQLINTAFGGGWLFFAYSTMKEENQVKNNSLIFEYLGVISFFSTMVICIISHFVYELLFSSDYVSGYIISPYLFLAPLLQMLFQVAANQFMVIKKTWPNMLILLLGAVTNVILNFILIPRVGIEGAAIATLFGYVVSDIVCIIILNKMKLFVISFRFLVICFYMTVFFILWRLYLLQMPILSSLLLCVFLIISYLFYRKDINILLNRRKGDKNE